MPTVIISFANLRWDLIKGADWSELPTFLCVISKSRNLSGIQMLFHDLKFKQLGVRYSDDN